MPLLVQRHSPGCILDPFAAMINLPPYGNILICVGGMYAPPIQPCCVRQPAILSRRQDWNSPFDLPRQDLEAGARQCLAKAPFPLGKLIQLDTNTPFPTYSPALLRKAELDIIYNNDQNYSKQSNTPNHRGGINEREKEREKEP